MTNEERTIVKLNEELDNYKEEYALLCRNLDKIADELGVAYYWQDSAIHNEEHYRLVCEGVLRKVKSWKTDRTFGFIYCLGLTVITVGTALAHLFF